MHGNVYEWCADWYYGGYSSEAAVDPKAPSFGTDRVVRGGGWGTTAMSVRTARARGRPHEFR